MSAANGTRYVCYVPAPAAAQPAAVTTSTEQQHDQQQQQQQQTTGPAAGEVAGSEVAPSGGSSSADTAEAGGGTLAPQQTPTELLKALCAWLQRSDWGACCLRAGSNPESCCCCRCAADAAAAPAAPSLPRSSLPHSTAAPASAPFPPPCRARAADHCYYRIEDWWTYELCYGKSLRQYHKGPGEVVDMQYVLGRYDAQQPAADTVKVP